MTAARRTLEEIEWLAAKATPGPWKVLHGSVTMHCCFEHSVVKQDEPDLVIAETLISAGADAALIAALPDLLAIAQGQREELERLRRLRDEVAKMAWPTGAPYCAALLDALNATMSEPYNLEKAIGTKK